MMQTRRLFIAGAVFVLLPMHLVVAQTTTLTVGVYPSNPPWENKTPSGEFEGYEVDVVRAVAKRIGVNLELQDYGFQALFSALSSNRIDAAISSITITNERLKSQSFTQGYYDTDLALATAAGSPVKSLEDMRGKTVGVIAATVSEAWVKANQKKYGFGELRTFNTAQDLLLDTQSGRLDGMVNDYTGLQFALKKMSGLTMAEHIPADNTFALMMRKNSPLLEKVNDAISQMKEDGTMASIHRRWLGTEADPNSSVLKVMPVPTQK